MPTINDVHQQFAEYFKEPALKPFLYLLSQKMSEGHICIAVDDLSNVDLPEVYSNHNLSLEHIKNHVLVTDGQQYKPFVLNTNRLYMQRYFSYETKLLIKIKTLIQSSAIQLQQRMQHIEALKPTINQLFTDNKNLQTNWQLVAAIMALLQDFIIITGGPGTGKTTTVAKILTLMFTLNPHLKVALAAPTGKAAARMTESLMKTQMQSDEMKAHFTKLKPSTIHRLLGWQSGTPYFRHNAENPLSYDVIIVDESSMIDVALFAKLMQAVGNGTRIILLGDKDQLASVEAGSLFGDLCNAVKPLNKFSTKIATFINQFIEGENSKLKSENITDNIHHIMFQHIVELQFSHRFAGDKGIGKISRAIIQNNKNELVQFIENQIEDTEVTIDQNYDEAIFLKFIEGYLAIFSKEKAFDEAEIITSLNQLNNLRILCAVKEGEYGVHQMNAKVEAYLAKKMGIQHKEEFYEYRPIMVTKNNYTLGLYNGDIGILKKDSNNVMKAWFLQADETGNMGLKSVLPGFIVHMETVYAMTIHKSQGSEFRDVLVVLPQQKTEHILTRELVYTAITRAREKVIIQAAPGVLLSAAEAQVERGSGVIERLQSESNL